MPTHVQEIDLENAKALEHVLAGFLHGACYEFAIAMHLGTGWPLVGLMHQGVVQHAVVRCSEGLYFDARGYVTEDKLNEPGFAAVFEICDIDERTLRITRQVLDHGLARSIAEALWPHLPWRHSLRSRMAAFVDELEDLSRKHGFWLRAVVPGAPSLIGPAYGDENGYSIAPIGCGREYSIDRCLK
ncbi:MAG: hypothetical protein Q8R39_00155 [bacterium]|nr:hypothetical protein [bacterium]MDZ4284498.1 hypothetical protein [Patescibacteria group bacterium]